MHGTPKDARVEVTSWTADFYEHVCQTTETVSDTRGTGVEPVVIRLERGIVKSSGAPGRSKLTIQTASTPWNQPSFPLACSVAMNSSRPTLPLSSIPSKTNRRFTGSSIPKSLCASRTLIHPKIGPLSSDDPRPMSWPLSAMVKVNGSVVHPSLFRAWIQKFRLHLSKIALIATTLTGWTSKWP